MTNFKRIEALERRIAEALEDPTLDLATKKAIKKAIDCQIKGELQSGLKQVQRSAESLKLSSLEPLEYEGIWE